MEVGSEGAGIVVAMSLDKAGALAKLSRGREHIGAVMAETQAYIAREPFTVTEAEQDDTHVWTVVNVKEQVPAHLALLVGDAVHNLRVALDHLAWALVASAGHHPDSKTCFPIRDHVRLKRRDVQEAMRGVPPPVIKTVIDQHQLHHADLWAVHRLDVVDKHRLVLVVGAAYTALHVRMAMTPPAHWPGSTGKEIEFPTLRMKPEDTLFPLKDGERVFGRPRDEADANTGFRHLPPGFEFEVALGADDTPLAGESLVVLERLASTVEAVISEF
jgi:hypothetical protein